jgi:hypothetical protein
MMLMMQMQLFTNVGCYSSTHFTRISTPRFLGKKRRKGLQVFDDLHKLGMIFFLEEVDMLHHDELNSSFRIFIPTVLKER